MVSQNTEKEWRKEWGEATEEEKQFYFPLITASIGLIGGLLLGLVLFTSPSDRMGYSINVYTGVLSTLVTIGVIDRLNERRARRQLKAQLIREMGSTDFGIASRAVEELRGHKWLYDGSLNDALLTGANLKGVNLDYAKLQWAHLDKTNLRRAYLRFANLNPSNLELASLRGADLTRANLSGAWMSMADMRGVVLYKADLQSATLPDWLQGAILDEANLQGAHVDDFALAQVKSLWGATMPDGSRYDGRFMLEDDETEETVAGRIAPPGVMVDILELYSRGSYFWADYYGVSVEAFERGRKWARDNLPQMYKTLRRFKKDGIPARYTTWMHHLGLALQKHDESTKGVGNEAHS